MVQKKVGDDEEVEKSETSLMSESRKTQILYISGGICSDTVTPIIGAIVEANSTKNPKVERIVIMIQSSGGDVGEAFALTACMKASSIPIYTVALGRCDSSALFIAMAGHYRFVAPRTSILSHQYSAGFGGMVKHIDLVARQRDFRLTEAAIVSHYIECSGMSEKEVRKQLLRENDVFLSPDEAISLGLFDEIFSDFEQFIIYEETQEEAQSESSEEKILNEGE